MGTLINNLLPKLNRLQVVIRPSSPSFFILHFSPYILHMSYDIRGLFIRFYLKGLFKPERASLYFSDFFKNMAYLTSI